MHHESFFEYYEETANWSFDEFGIHTENLTDWDLYEILSKVATTESRILDLGTGGGENALAHFPDCAEVLATDFSPNMIKTARANLAASGRTNFTFKVMDNLKMEVPDNYFDIVVARHTCTEPEQILKCLKPGGYLLIRGVDKYDCWALKMVFGGGQGYNDPKPISILDYENIIRAGFSEVELVPIHDREYIRDRATFKAFLSKVPILEFEGDSPDDKLLDEYIAKNTFSGGIRLLRAYYGITARKPF